MKSRFILICLMLTGVSFTLKAQQLDPLQILPFNSEEYEDKLNEKFQLDTLMLNQDTLIESAHNPYTMRIIDLPQNRMAQMPTMPLRHDVHYHMRIKKYDNYYAPNASDLRFKLPPNQQDQPTEKPEE